MYHYLSHSMPGWGVMGPNKHALKLIRGLLMTMVRILQHQWLAPLSLASGSSGVPLDSRKAIPRWSAGLRNFGVEADRAVLLDIGVDLLHRPAVGSVENLCRRCNSNTRIVGIEMPTQHLERLRCFGLEQYLRVKASERERASAVASFHREFKADPSFLWRMIPSTGHHLAGPQGTRRGGWRGGPRTAPHHCL